MAYLDIALRQTDWELFDMMSAALRTVSHECSIEYHPVQGWPFAWLIHPGFSDGLTVGDSTSIHRLRETGLINVIHMPETGNEDRIALTSHGQDMVELRRLLHTN